MKAYYNEHAPFPAQWLKNLIRDGLLQGGVVDDKSIGLISANDLRGFTQFHTFCGVGGWPIALQQAGWPDDRPVWTGSCPCQPFSAAGKQKGTSDDRHLWPEFLRLIAACRPPHIFGEQVSGRKVTGKLYTQRAWERIKSEDRRAAEEADAQAWFKLVQTDLEGIGYVVGHIVIPACGFGAPHLRQRLYWYARYVGDSKSGGRGEERPHQRGLRARAETSQHETRGSGAECSTCDVADLHENGQYKRGQRLSPTRSDGAERDSSSCGMGDTLSTRLEGYSRHGDGIGKPGREPTEKTRSTPEGCEFNRPGPTNGHWRAADWIYCRDDKWRPVEPGSSPLAYGVLSRASKISAGIRWLGFSPKTFKAVLRESKAILKAARASRKGQLTGYGNAIVIPQAVAFIQACMEEES